MDIEKLADEFFEWDGPRTPVVSFVSAKLFARHVAELALKDAAATCSNYGLAWPVTEGEREQNRTAGRIASDIRDLSRQITEGK